MRIQRLHHFAAFSMTGALLALGAFGQAPLPADAAVNWAGQGKTGESLLKTEKTAQRGLKLLAEVAENECFVCPPLP